MCGWLFAPERGHAVQARSTTGLFENLLPTTPGRTSHVPWNFSGGPMMIRPRARSHHDGATDSLLGDMPLECGA
jgi:hypothetical protein